MAERYTVDFKNPIDLRFTKPCLLDFYGRVAVGFASWKELYVAFCESAFAMDNIRTLEVLTAPSGMSPRFARPKDKDTLRSPSYVSSADIYLETNCNAGEMVRRIASIVENCRFDPQRIRIEFVPLRGFAYASVSSNRGRSYFLPSPGSQRSYSSPSSSQRSCRSSASYSQPQKAAIMSIPQKLLQLIRDEYKSGFRFENNVINLIEPKLGFHFSPSLQERLKGLMFCRPGENLYFLRDQVMEPPVFQTFLKETMQALNIWHFFEIDEVYRRYADRIDPVCIRNVEDFENWLSSGSYYGTDVRFISVYKKRIVRGFSYTKEFILCDFVKRLCRATEENYGTLDENAIRERFPEFSLELIKYAVQNYGEDQDLIASEVNEQFCLQTFEAIGLPDDLSETITSIIERFRELDVAPTIETINAFLSDRYGYPFRPDHYLTDDKTFRRLVAKYYRGDIPRKWKGSVFGEEDV